MTMFAGGEQSQLDLENWLDTRPGTPHSGAAVVHIDNADCACNRLMRAARRSLDRDAAAENVPVYEIVAAAPGNLPNAVAPAWRVDAARLRSWVSATPAVVIFNTEGKVAYAGPLQTSLRCSPPAADAALVRYSRATHILSPEAADEVGCFCAI